MSFPQTNITNKCSKQTNKQTKTKNPANATKITKKGNKLTFDIPKGSRKSSGVTSMPVKQSRLVGKKFTFAKTFSKNAVNIQLLIMKS